VCFQAGMEFEMHDNLGAKSTIPPVSTVSQSSLWALFSTDRILYGLVGVAVLCASFAEGRRVMWRPAAIKMPNAKVQRASRVAVEPSILDLGHCQAGQSVTGSWTLRNLTETPLEIKGFRVSCGCISLDEVPQILPPHACHVMPVSMEIASAGKYTGQIVIEVATEIPGHVEVASIQLTASTEMSNSSAAQSE